MCDIQAKFRQVKVDVEHCNLLRFLWWEKPERKEILFPFPALVLPKISCMLRKKLEYTPREEVFWTDSKTV